MVPAHSVGGMYVDKGSKALQTVTTGQNGRFLGLSEDKNKKTKIEQFLKSSYDSSICWSYFTAITYIL